MNAKEYFDKLNIKTTPEPFWKTCKPYFSNKHSHGGSKTTLTENDKIISQSNKIAKTFDTYFESVTNSLNLLIVTKNSNKFYLIFQTSKYT